METMTRENWTDERLDEFGKRIDERFDRVDERFDDLRQEMRGEFAQVDKGFAHVNNRLDQLGDAVEMVQRAIVFGSVSLSTAFVAGFITLAFKI